MNKPILCLDFDGVIHSYERGWQNGAIYGTTTPGFWEWLEEANEFFKIVVYSSRSATPQGIHDMQMWLYREWRRWRENGGKTVYTDPVELEFADKKPSAFLTIDDRGITFKGNWTDFDPQTLRDFKPWNVS